MASRWHTVVIDARDPKRLARWWAEVLGYRLLSEAGDEVVIGDGAGGGPGLMFAPAGPDRRGGRLHLDLHPDDPDAEVERLLDMGARPVDGATHRTGAAGGSVLADPEGNEFCVLRVAGGDGSP